jgi:hypothetical protein
VKNSKNFRISSEIDLSGIRFSNPSAAARKAKRSSFWVWDSRDNRNLLAFQNNKLNPNIETRLIL